MTKAEWQKGKGLQHAGGPEGWRVQPGGVGDAVHTCRVSLAPDLGIPPKPPRGQGSAPHGLFWALLGPLQGRAPPEEADLARARVHVHTLCVYMCVHACRLCAQVCMLCARGHAPSARVCARVCWRGVVR